MVRVIHYNPINCGVCGKEVVRTSASQKYCKECNPKIICIHNKLKRCCKECTPKIVCVHNKIKYNCTECNTSLICKHNSVKKYCKENKIKLEDYKGILPYRKYIIEMMPNKNKERKSKLERIKKKIFFNRMKSVWKYILGRE